MYTRVASTISNRMNQKARYVFFFSFVSLNSFNGIAFARIGSVSFQLLIIVIRQ